MAEILKIKRGRVKARLTRFETFLNELDLNSLNDIMVRKIELTIIKIEDSWGEFYQIQYEIEEEFPDEDHDVERESFEDSQITLIAKGKQICADYYKTQNPIQGSDQGSVISAGSAADTHYGFSAPRVAQLPTIKLTTFDGQYQNWPEFRDIFQALVGKDEHLPPIQKFYYLKSALGDEPAEVIKSMDVTNDNYESAWQLLTERYENKSLMIHSHIKAIFELQTVSKESHVELRQLYDSITKHLRSLSALGENTDSWDRLVIYIMTQKFDITTRRDWESYKYENSLPSMKDMNQFLKEKCAILEKLTDKNTVEKTNKGQWPRRKSSSNSLVSSNDGKLSCRFCKESHVIYNCPDFLKLSIEKRIAEIKTRKLCTICLRPFHSAWNCKARRCIKCNKNHNSLLHIDLAKAVPQLDSTAGGSSNATQNPNESSTNATVTRSKSIVNKGDSVRVTGPTQVLLATARVKLKIENKWVYARALLDSGSQSNFVTEEFCDKLELKKVPCVHTVKGVGQLATNINNRVNITIFSCYTNFSIELNCLVIPHITEVLPKSSFDKSSLQIPTNIQLADPTFNISNEIDILLGSQVFWTVVQAGQKGIGKNMPILQNTKFGWVIAGNCSTNVDSSLSLLNVHKGLDEEISKFWQLEEVSNDERKLSEADRYCENYFEKTVRRNDSGKFIVSMPFKRSVINLGNSRSIALNRFEALERKLNKNPELKKYYCDFMMEYEALNHMKEIPETEHHLTDGYFLPHHAILKDSSITTKCRVVFDASCKTDNGLALNDVQFTGPALQTDIFEILLRFRKYRYVLTADISKMYRQILLEQNQRKYQKIFWRSDPRDPLKCFELCTVTYGNASSPYLAIRCLIQIAKENRESFPESSSIIATDFYMDDLITGADSVSDILKIQTEISELLSNYGFDLRKWLCNEPNILNLFKIKNNLEVGILHLGENESNKTLGIYWHANSDQIQYTIRSFPKAEPTKRSILSIICQIFDPLGLIGPVIVISKLIMQKMWKQKIDWDDPLPTNIRDCWINFQNELSSLNELKIPRFCLTVDYVSIELHGFSDASEKAYGACIYVRTFSTATGFHSHLLSAKSRVAPVKTISLPRLELCGAVLLAQLAHRVVKSLNIKFDKKYFWTDSQITLAWIHNEPSKWKTFIANRVSDIQSLTNITEWHHVKSNENPADLLSRGVRPTLMSESHLWWNGPEWLARDKKDWELVCLEFPDEIPEQKSISETFIVINHDESILDLINRISTFQKLQRILAYILRFSQNLKLPQEKRSTEALTPNELENAVHLLIQTVQKSCFPREYNALNEKKEIHSKSSLLSLNPFIHKGLIRVGGRLQQSKIPFDKKHQIILPKGHRLTEMIIRSEHQRLLHCNAQILLCNIREKFWPLYARNVCKKIIRTCIQCFKAKPLASKYLMGNLPESRVNENLPFTNVGVDYGGPFIIKDRKTRGAKTSKAYVCLFICMASKAVHLELVSALTTAAFFDTFKRFIARRGKPSNVWSDNGSNFVGANRELQILYEFLSKENDSFSTELAKDRINWHFIPARSPNFGGIWEAGIKGIKHHLKRVVGDAKLTFEDLCTLLTQIEGVLNSRPICPISSDPEDLTALTPAHLLIGRSLNALPEISVMTIPENRLNQYQRLQAITQHFWTRWYKEYLSQLQTRTKWKQSTRTQMKVGSLVLVQEDHVPSYCWPLGRVTALYPGKDNVVRVVEVQTQRGLVKRAVSKVCLLPTE